MANEAFGHCSHRFRDEIARRKAGLEGWLPYLFEAVGDDVVLLTGCMPTILARGARRGEQSWDTKNNKPVRVAVVSTEIVAAARAFVDETGFCARCLGSRRTVRSFGVGGVVWGECRDCKGTGLATYPLAGAHG